MLEIANGTSSNSHDSQALTKQSVTPKHLYLQEHSYDTQFTHVATHADPHRACGCRGSVGAGIFADACRCPGQRRWQWESSRAGGGHGRSLGAAGVFEENTGANIKVPELPTMDNATAIAPFPDPFGWVNDPLGKNRSTDFKDWEHHRAEIIAMIEHYEIGEKPAVDIAKQVKAVYTPDANGDGKGGSLVITVTNAGQSIDITCPIGIAPDAKAPYPVIIGMNSYTGSLPANDFLTRGFCAVTFRHNDVTTYGGPTANDPFFKLYPNLKFSSDKSRGDTGQYAAWAWGVSRIIDGLSLVQDKLPIDMKHITVTGCSYAGKMALFSGALDERVALTVAQESGGGGATNWRYSATEPKDAQGKASVEGIGNTDHKWFKSDMFSWASNVSKLPEDHHMLCALCAPRALYVTGNTGYTWLSNKSNYANSAAVSKIYRTLGIADRFGYCINGNHAHCQFPASQEPELTYFLDKFMKGQSNLSMIVATIPDDYSSINVSRWTAWWGTGNPELPPLQ